MERKDIEIDILCDYSVKMIEREIIQGYNNTRCYDSDNGALLSLRKNIINKEILAHQKELLPDIIAFNDALREALREMYDRAHRIWKKLIQNIDETDGEEMELTAKCYFDADYPALHPIQGGDSISVLTLTFPRDEGQTFESFIGMDCPPPNWNEGLDQELTKNLHLISQFHNLFQHMLFAITDFVYVRKFYSGINVNIIKGLQDHV